MDKCPTCGEYFPSKWHKCRPLWLALDHDYCGEDWEDAYEVRAIDADDAAARGGEAMDDSGGEGPHERTIYVRPAPDGPIEGPFNITFEYSVDYSARRAASEVKDAR